MGCAEIGRELGDAGDPLLVGATATALTLPSGLLTLAATLTTCAAALALTRLPATPHRRYSDSPLLLSASFGTVQRTVFSARHAGLWSGGMGTVSDDI
jgi:hypothetical protein